MKTLIHRATSTFIGSGSGWHFSNCSSIWVSVKFPWALLIILKTVMSVIRKMTLAIISCTVSEVIPSARHWGLCFMYVAWFYVCCLISSAKPLQITSTDALLILFLAVLGLHCCRISLVAERGGYSLVAVLRLLISVASLREHGLEEHGLSSCGRATGHVGSWNRNQTHVPCIGRWIINHWTIREALISTLRKGKAKKKKEKERKGSQHFL